MSRLEPDRTTAPSPASSASRSARVWSLGWLLAVAAGFGTLGAHEAESAAAPHAPMELSAALVEEAGLDPARGARGLVFLHPRCPCTLQTLEQLEAVIAAAPSAGWTLLVVTPPELAEADVDAFVDGPAGREAHAVAARHPRVTVRLDRGGRVAAHFDARHSGAVVAYGASGALVFSGGITAGRGHSGPGRGRAALVTALSDPRTPPVEATFPVRGCALSARTLTSSTPPRPSSP